MTYKETHGDCEVPQTSGALGTWCSSQRARKATLSQDRIDRLHALGFRWDDYVDALWDQSYTALVAFQKDNGHCNVTNGSLGDWCKNVRARRKKGTLTPDQIALLEAIGFHWEVRKSLWEKNYAELVAYKEINGHCNVPKEKGSFGNWCDTQRQFRRKGKLSSEQIARLDALGFCWDFIAALWDKNIAELVAFKKIHGHCNATTWSHGSLGHWCQRVRALRKKGELSKERYAQLNALGFRWNLKDNDELAA